MSSRKGGGRSAWGVILNKFSSADACLAGASLALSNRVRRTCRGIGKVVDLAAAAIIASAGYFRVNAGIAWNGVQFIADCFSRDARVQTTLCARAAFVEEVLLALESLGTVIDDTDARMVDVDTEIGFGNVAATVYVARAAFIAGDCVEKV